MNRDPLTHAFIGHAMKTHSDPGLGLGEEFYHQNHVSRLTEAGIEHLSKPRRDMFYKGHVADTFEAEIVILETAIANLEILAKRLVLSITPAIVIEAAATERGCTTLYSEDFAHGQFYGTVQVINPFI